MRCTKACAADDSHLSRENQIVANGPVRKPFGDGLLCGRSPRAGFINLSLGLLVVANDLSQIVTDAEGPSIWDRNVFLEAEPFSFSLFTLCVYLHCDLMRSVVFSLMLPTCSSSCFSTNMCTASEATKCVASRGHFDYRSSWAQGHSKSHACEPDDQTYRKQAEQSEPSA
eukprot:TRINITY_DN6019_c0_g5_i1.p1 TRINITY_DN6019_c0_g5~~TRINITY_DN6019_c0_g5_i1.p1  ORF type:complete len:170 (+),score=8.03 TRINITY_DN6019_c0_g5_i1:254-763(+)